MTYAGSLLGFFIFSFIADNYGRRPGLGLSWFAATVGALVLASSRSFEMVGVGIFMLGFGVNPAITIQYSLFNEHTCKFKKL
jgi:MFS family permease